MKPQILSAKSTANRLLISRWGVVVVALAVLAAGCSQSEDGASEGSEPTASTSQTGLSSAAPPSPAAESTTTTQASVEEELQGSRSGIATATTLLSSAEGGYALSGRVVELVDAGVDVCADLYEMRCARALWDACMQVRIELGNILRLRVNIPTSETIEIDDLREDICQLFQMVQYWELHSILLAKYGDNFYRSDTGFYSFREETSNVHLPGNHWRIYLFPVSCDPDGCFEDVGTIDDLEDESTFAEYLPDASRIELLRFAFNMREVFADLNPSAVSMSEDVANRILTAYEASEVDEQCYTPLLTGISSNYKDGALYSYNYSSMQRNLYSCIKEQCDNGNESFYLGCYQCSEEYEKFFNDCEPGLTTSGFWPEQSIAIPKNGRVYQYINGSSYSMRLLFWEILKFSCVTGEINPDAYADDTCRTVAYNSCSIIRRLPLSDKSFSEIESAVCDLGRELERLIFENAKQECLRELEIFLTNESLFSASDGRCNNATQRCLELKGEFEYQNCGGFEKYFHTETYWKNIPTLCSQGNQQAVTFGESECYNSINLFCASELNSDRFLDEFESENMPFREREKISSALCDALLPYYENIVVSESEKLNLLPNESQTILVPIDFYDILDPETIDIEQTSTELTSNNLDLIISATTACTAISPPSGNSECAVELWKSCFDLFYSRAEHESNESEVYRSSEYVCTAAWIAELARMASALLTSFSEDYQAGSFYQFLRYITGEAVERNESILAIDENGTARPNLNREGLSSEVTENLTALGMSIVQLVQPYLAAANNQTRQSTA